MKPISDFASRFGTKISFDETFVVKRQRRYFLLNENLKALALNNFFHAGAYLGKIKHGKFVPSFNLLNMIAQKNVNSIVVDKKTEWLFVCGRDVFKQGIMTVAGSQKKGDYSLVLNSFGECLGFGRIVYNLYGGRGKLALKNLLDIGDFLRRER